LLDYAHSHGVALSEQRAARAIAAGRGAELRRRLESRTPESNVTAGLSSDPDLARHP
jgi:hypothetical protein